MAARPPNKAQCLKPVFSLYDPTANPGSVCALPGLVCVQGVEGRVRQARGGPLIRSIAPAN